MAQSVAQDAQKIADDEWDETRIQSALTRLQQVHVYLRQLRDTVPSILRPIHAEHNSPETLFAEFHQAATGAVSNINQFKQLIQDPQSQEALLRARESKAKNADGIQTWLVSQHADWLDVPLVKSAKELKIEEEDKPEKEASPPGGGGAEESVAKMVQTFKTSESFAEGVEMNVNEDKRNIALTLPAPAKLSFLVTWDAQPPPARVYKAICKGPSKLHNSINQALSKRPNPNDLKQTLEMVIAYSDVRTTRCDKCKKLLDFDGQFAAVKVRKKSTPAGGPAKPQWDSFHPACS